MTPPSDLLYGSLGGRNRVENARAGLIGLLDDVIEALALPAVRNAHPRKRRDRFWAFTNAGWQQALHARIAAKEVSPVARAFALMPQASLVFEALLSARRRGFPARHVPALVAHRIGFVPGPPVAWALLARAAGFVEEPAPRRRSLRTRADAWRKRLGTTARLAA